MSILKDITLTQFRKFGSQTISMEKPWTIIIAPNATGKSTIIEALYMLSHGESPWEQQNENLIQNNSEKKAAGNEQRVARIEATIETPDEESQIALALTSNGKTSTKRYQIDGDSTNRSKFMRSVTCLLFSPDLIDVLMYEPAQRRRFLDLYTAKLYPDITDLASKYKNVLRQRNSLLKQLSNRNGGSGNSNGNGFQNKSLSFWTEQLIAIGAEIIQLRLQFISKLNEASTTYPTKIIYIPTVQVHELEDLATAESIQESFQNILEEKHRQELRVGATLAGPHRDDWFLETNGADISTFGSRGEKRMAISDIIFKMSGLLTEEMKEKPILLLDDITSELDAENIELLFSDKIDPTQQVIITTTHKESLPDSVTKTSHTVLL